MHCYLYLDCCAARAQAGPLASALDPTPAGPRTSETSAQQGSNDLLHRAAEGRHTIKKIDSRPLPTPHTNTDIDAIVEAKGKAEGREGATVGSSSVREAPKASARSASLFIRGIVQATAAHARRAAGGFTSRMGRVVV